MASPVKNQEVKSVSEDLEFKRNKDRTLVKGKFIYHEVPKGKFEFVHRVYKGDPIEKYSMRDGEIVSIPLGVAKHLNTNCWYPAYQHKTDEAGRPSCQVVSKVRRCSFQSLEFIDIEGVDPIGSAISGM